MPSSSARSYDYMKSEDRPLCGINRHIKVTQSPSKNPDRDEIPKSLKLRRTQRRRGGRTRGYFGSIWINLGATLHVIFLLECFILMCNLQQMEARQIIGE